MQSTETALEQNKTQTTKPIINFLGRIVSDNHRWINIIKNHVPEDAATLVVPDRQRISLTTSAEELAAIQNASFNGTNVFWISAQETRHRYRAIHEKDDIRLLALFGYALAFSEPNGNNIAIGIEKGANPATDQFQGLAEINGIKIYDNLHDLTINALEYAVRMRR